MKKNLLSLFLGLSLILVVYTASSQDWKKIDGSKSSIETNVKLLNSSENHISMEFEFNAYALINQTTSKGMSNLIDIPGCSRTQEKGSPDLPVITRSVAIPDYAEMKVNLVKSKYIEIDGVDLVPSKGVLSRQIDPATVPYVYGDVYNKNAFYPSNIIESNDPYIIRNVRGQSVRVHPVQYNPVSKKIRIYTSLVVDVVSTGKTGKNTLTKNTVVENDDVFENVLSNHFINYQENTSKLSESNKKMLIVSYSGFTSVMQAFKSWKESIGYTVSLVDYSTIGSASALKTYVQNQYTQNGISYLLLVGDHAQVPASSTSAGYSDNNYGYTSGSDHYLDIFVGRFSAENTTQLQTQIDRTIHYERDLSSSDTWFKKGVGIASNEGGSGGDDGETDEQHMNNIEYDLEGYGYAIDRVYQDGGSASMLSSYLNSGRGIINYVGHGSNTSWASMVYTQTNVNSLTNENKLPFVISVACVVGNFTGITCFAETWLRATNNGNPTGAIVFCGSTINQSWASPMCAQDKMNDLLVANSYITYGGMFVNGMFQMISEYGTDGINMADTWTVFGDPSVQMRTPGNPDGPNGGVVTPPTANFTASSTSVTEGNTVTYTSTSTGNPASYYWEFEGGTPSTSTSTSPTVTYNTIGNYDVKLTVTNSAGSDSETKANYITVSEYIPEYCSSAGSNYNYEWIAGVQVGIFNNTSTAAGYTDFTNKTIEMAAGTAYNITLTPGFASTTYDEYWKIWIDLNGDADFDDVNELVFDAGALSKNAVTGTVTIPAGTSAKSTRMRVSMKYNAAQTACETFSYGEVEDYTVNIVESGGDTQAPTAPTNLNATSITQTSFTLNWTASSDNVGVTGYDVYQNGSLLGSVAGTSANISGLTAATTYSYYVKAKDAAGNISVASSSLSVTTASPVDTQAPTAPSNLTSSNVGETSATLSWTASTDNIGVTGYDIYRNGSVMASTANTSYNVTGLTAATTYSFYVKAKDAAGNVSAASNTISVTTDDIVAEYCTSKGNNSSYEWIAKVQIGTYSKSSGAAGYTDFTSENISLAAGSAVNIVLTPGFASSTYNEYWKIWIDYNNDKVFDNDELAFDAGSLSKTAVNGTMNIPSNASGTTRMRVSMKYNGAQTACESFSYGEVEDYTVTFTSGGGDTQAPTAPASLAASAITQTSLTLSWNASTDNVGVTAYDVYQNGSLLGSVTGTSANVTGLTASTTYSFYVKAKDAAGNISAASNTINVTTSGEQLTYCSSKGNNSSYEWIDLVQLNEINNTTANNGGYADFTNLVANVNPGSSQTIYFSCGFSGSTYTEYWHVWIDWDHSGTFDSDELMVSGSSSSSATLSATFTVPSDAVLGTTRMRVTMKYNAAATACESFSYGEVEDYTVNVTTGAQSYAFRDDANATPIGNEPPTQISLYPVPADSYIQLDVLNGTKECAVSIYNIQGSLVKVVEMFGNSREINVSELPAGSYILSVEDEKGTITKQFVKK